MSFRCLLTIAVISGLSVTTKSIDVKQLDYERFYFVPDSRQERTYSMSEVFVGKRADFDFNDRQS